LQNPSISNVQTSNAGIYTVTVNDGTGSCSSTLTVVVNPNPVPTIDPLTPICLGDSSVVTAQGGNSYQWSTGSTNQSITVTPTSTTTYTVTVSTTAGCSATTSASLVVYNLPVATITPPGPLQVCEGNAVNITASGGATYVWSNGNTTNTINEIPTGNTTYTVTVYSSEGCSSTTSVDVSTVPSPVAQINPTDTSVCVGQNVSLVASGGTSYVWNTGNTTASLSTGPGIYTVTVFDTNGCSDSETANIAALPLPNVSFSGTLACFGQATQFTNNTSISSGSINSYFWNLGDGNTGTDVNPSHTYDTSGFYIVSLTAVSDAGCSGSFTDTIPVGGGPDISIQATPLCFMQLQAEGINNNPNQIVSNWTCDWGDFNQDTGQIRMHTYSVSGTYTVTLSATDAFGCLSTIQTTITTKGGKTLDQLQIPNVLSPNGDSVNDELVLDQEFEECSPYTLSIFNRWGVKVYEIQNGGTPFSGISNTGSTIVPGTYFVVIQSNDLKYHGTLTLFY
jgi:PKD repeat protein